MRKVQDCQAIICLIIETSHEHVYVPTDFIMAEVPVKLRHKETVKKLIILPQYYSPTLHLIIYACQICKIEKAKKCGKTENFLKVCTRSGLTVYEEILRR